MKDKLLYLTIGLLVGIVVMQWTATPQHIVTSAQAGYVDLTRSPIAAIGGTPGDPDMLLIDDSGVVWQASVGPAGPVGWQQGGEVLPVPIHTIKFVDLTPLGGFLVTLSNEAWIKHRVSGYPGKGQWLSIGAWPGPTVPSESSTIGGVKGQYQGKDNQ